MTPQEYQAIREGMGMSRAELAQALGVTYQTIQFRESGRVPIRTEAEEAIRSLAEPGKLLEDVATFIASAIEARKGRDAKRLDGDSHDSASDAQTIQPEQSS